MDDIKIHIVEPTRKRISNVGLFETLVRSALEGTPFPFAENTPRIEVYKAVYEAIQTLVARERERQAQGDPEYKGLLFGEDGKIRGFTTGFLVELDQLAELKNL